MDTNAAQFERLGNPWISEADRRETWEISHPSRKIKRNTPRHAVPRSEPVEPRGTADRSESAAFRQIKRSNAFLKAFKSGLPGGTRAVAGLTSKPAGQVVVLAPGALCESRGLNSDERAEHTRQRAETAARLAEGSRQTMIAEAKRARSAKLARMFADVEDFGDVMAAALDA